MTFIELVNKLKGMYENAPNSYQVAMIHLFGIKYHKEIEEIKKGYSLEDLAEKATGFGSYGKEIAKGMKLARFVKPLD